MSGPKFHVYTALDANRKPLYVGFTGNLAQRMSDHRKTSTWHERMAHLLLLEFETEKQAREVETRRIAKLRPTHNIRHNPARITVAQAIARNEWREEWTAMNGNAQSRAEWISDHPETSVQTRKWARLADMHEPQAGAA